jgi:glucokinase
VAASGLAVGVDVGGTKLASALVSSDGTIIDRRRDDTPADDPDAVVDLVADVVTAFAARHGIARMPVGLGAPGAVDATGTVRYAPNVAFANYPLRERLEERLSGPVVVDNDGNIAAWAEFVRGAGRDARDAMVMLTVGTGVGGGLVLGGALTRGAHGYAAEFGHLIVAEGGPPCPCGNRGCLEAVASGTAIGRRAEERRSAGDLPEDSLLWRPGRLSGKDVTVAAFEGDAAAAEVIAEAGFWLGVGIASLVNALDPELVVVGGGAMQAGDLLLDPARAACKERVMGARFRAVPTVQRALLADDAGVIGGALLALDLAGAG